VYLEAVNLTKKYGDFYALRNLNLQIKGKGCIGYLGPNGAGKTTTLKLFTNLLRPTSGEAIINGYSVKKEPKKALHGVGTLIEVSKSGIKDALQRVRLYEWRDKKVGKFSKGMKQRLALAVALVIEPEILILDEPTTGMDPQGMKEIREIIKELKKEGILIFMSSHLLPEVTYVCDEVAMLHRGRLILYDTIENLSRKFSGSSVVVELLTPIENVREIEDIDDIRAVELISPYKLRISFTGGAEKQYEILREMIERGYKVVSFQGESLALEEAYVKLIGGESL